VYALPGFRTFLYISYVANKFITNEDFFQKILVGNVIYPVTLYNMARWLLRGETFRNSFYSHVSKFQNCVFKNPPLNMILGYFDPFHIVVRYLFIIRCLLVLPHHLI
jgi:hypothetical protein